MRKSLMIILSVFAVFVLLSSCSTSYEEAGLTGEVVAKDYEVLGPVYVSGSNHNILGIIGWGGIGYNDLLAEARKLYPETDAVINVTKDVKTFNVLLFYNSFGFDLSGLAIRYVDNADNHSVNLDVSIAE